MNEQRNAGKRGESQMGRFKDEGKSISSRMSRQSKVLAERNPPVVPVGAWVETGADKQEHPAARARLTEEVHEEVRREKEENLRRFQEAVRRRVSRQAQLQKQQQLQRSYEMTEKECRVVQQSSDAAKHLTPRKSPFPSWPQGELAIGSPSSRLLGAQDVEFLMTDDANQYTHQISRVMKQVRHRLAARQTVRDREELSELPGGIWKMSPTRDVMKDQKEAEDEEDQENKAELGEEAEIPLAGQHDRPLHLHCHTSKTVTFQNNAACGRILKETIPTFHKSDYRSTLVLWPKEDEEELKRQKQSQFLVYRRLFMDIEREQVKEHQRHRKHLRRIGRIKAEKERQRREEENKMEQMQRQEERRMDLAERERLILEQLRLEEEEHKEEVKRREREKKVKENTRYIEALRAQMKEKMEQEKVDLPPLCCCGDNFWDAHPDTCANNCVFYNNPKGYAQALHSVLLSCDLNEGSTGHRGTTWKIASMHALSPRK